LFDEVDEVSLLLSLHSMLPEFENSTDISLLVSELYQKVSSEMIAIGFYQSAILSGFAFVLTSHSHSDGLLLNYALLRSSLLEYLCLSVNEAILPEVNTLILLHFTSTGRECPISRPNPFTSSVFLPTTGQRFD
jgi:hypothetical protein